MPRVPANTWSPKKRPSAPRRAVEQAAPKPRRQRRSATALTAGLPWKAIGVGGAGVAVVALVALLVIWLVSGHDDAGEQSAAGQPVPTGLSEGGVAGSGLTPAEDVQQCEEKSGEVTQGNGAGDRVSAAGLIMAYEHAFFVLRDPRAMVSMTTSGSSVATESALQSGLAQIPEATPWCVTISATGEPNKYMTTIRFIDSDGDVVMWRQLMTVLKRNATVSDSWTITAVQEAD